MWLVTQDLLHTGNVNTENTNDTKRPCKNEDPHHQGGLQIVSTEQISQEHSNNLDFSFIIKCMSSSNMLSNNAVKQSLTENY